LSSTLVAALVEPRGVESAVGQWSTFFFHAPGDRSALGQKHPLIPNNRLLTILQHALLVG